MDASGRSGGSDDLRGVVQELTKSVECIVGEPAQRDTAGAKRHLDQAKRLLGDSGRGESREMSGRSGSEGSSRGDESGRSQDRNASGRSDDPSRDASRSASSNRPSGNDETQGDVQRAMR